MRTTGRRAWRPNPAKTNKDHQLYIVSLRVEVKLFTSTNKRIMGNKGKWELKADYGR